MTNDLARRLAEHGIDVPRLDPLSPLGAGVTVLGFACAGEQAPAWWRSLRAVSEHTGYWPLLVESDRSVFLADPLAAEVDAEAGPVQRLAQAAELDSTQVLNPRGMTLDSLGDDQRQELLEEWPDEPHRIDGFSLPFARDGQPRPTLVALVAAEHGWQVPALLGYGNWNQCPAPAVHSAVLRHWHHHYGADLVCMTSTSIELAVARPPQTRPAALAFAWEYASYCLDSVDGIYQADNLAGLAASLIDAEVVVAWWD
jgi:Domain of unknown function (DUF4253)